MQTLISIKTWLEGKKTFIIGIAAIVYGLYTKNSDAIIIGSGLMGIRGGLLTTEQNLLALYYGNGATSNTGETASARPTIPAVTLTAQPAGSKAPSGYDKVTPGSSPIEG